jgi:hypothetical protein
VDALVAATPELRAAQAAAVASLAAAVAPPICAPCRARNHDRCPGLAAPGVRCACTHYGVDAVMRDALPASVPCRCGCPRAAHRDDDYGTSCATRFCHCDRYEPKETRTMTTREPETMTEAPAAPPVEEAPPVPPPVVEPSNDAPMREPEFAATAPPVASDALTLDPSDPRWALALQPASARDAMILATVIFKSGMFPTSKYRNRDMIFAVIQMGREHGISALLALQSMHVIEGKVEMSADLIAALVLRSGKAKRFACVETDDEHAVYEAQRHDDPAPMRIAFTKKNAQDRGLWGKGNWLKMPDVMLAHRACTKAARLKFPEVTVGIYGSGEIRETRLADVDDGLDAAADRAIAARDAKGRAA